MSKISNQNAYPLANPADGSYIIGTDVTDLDTTKTYLFSGVFTYINEKLTDSSMTPVYAAEKVVQKVRFKEDVLKGEPVYISGYNQGQNFPEVSKADSSNPSHMPSFGLADDDYDLNSNGYIISSGDLNDLNTAILGAVGQTLYVAPGGGLTTTKPTGSNLIQNVGTISRSNANNGSVEVSTIGRSNDVPNLSPGKIWVGSTGNTIESSSITFTEATGAVQLNEYGSGLVVGTPAYNLAVDASGNVIEASIAASPVGGTGNANYIPLWQDSSTLVDSVIFQEGATTNSAVSIGVSNTISNQSYSIGGSNTSSSVNSVAVGFNNTVNTKNQNLAVGSNNTVSAGNSQALGSQNTVLFTLGAPGTGSASSLIGSQNSSDGARVFILGGSNTSSTGSNDVALVGRSNIGTNGRTYAFGDTNVAAAFRAFAIGAANTTASQSSLLIGTNNLSDGGIYQHVLGRNNNINYNVGIAAFPSNVVLAGLSNTTQWNNAYHFGRGLGSGAANQVLIGHFAELSTKSLSYVGIGVGSGTSDRLTAMSFKKEQGGGAQIFAEALYNAASYADDTAAAAGGVELGQLYRTGSTVKIRMT